MRKLALAISIAPFFALLGCGPTENEIVWQGDRRTANPPPKPPQCPELPELANVTKPDGTIIDVRIIQIDDVKFYVPANWNRWPDTLENLPATSDTALGRYDPDINAVECPGVVHRFVSKRAHLSIGWDFVVRRANAEPWIKPNFTLETKIDSVSIGRPRAVTDPSLKNERTFKDGIIDWPSDSSPAATIVVVPDHLTATYPWSKDKPVGSPEWEAARDDVIDLVNWLRTPPIRRENDRVFKLGVRS